MSLTIGSITISALNTGAKRLAVSADNVARRNVPNSEKNRLIQETQAQGGVTSYVDKVELSDAEKSDSTDYLSSSTNIDYAEESLNQTIADTSIRASLLVYKRAGELEDNILSMLA
ncbi:hypothetical protein K1X76_04960 [bacterium]|nr:hypothetical protein [bacterium]